MITRYEAGVTLADREALAALLHRPASTIRARCTPIAHDLETRRALYDAGAAIQALGTLQRRRRHTTRQT